MIDTALHLTWGSGLCAAALAVPPMVGWYLFKAGCKDFGKGCQEMGAFKNPLYDTMELLVKMIPVCVALRVFCTPALWYYMADERDFSSAMMSAPVLAWILLWVVPFALYSSVIWQSGVHCVHSSDRTMAEWPQEHFVQRPYHGLMSTRAHAGYGGMWIELLWNVAIVVMGPGAAPRVGTITVPLLIFNAGMLMGGPVNFLTRSPTVDAWIGETYLLVSIIAVEGLLLLNHAWFGLKVSVNSEGKLGPYGHWATLLWLGLLAIQTFVCRSALLSGQELKGGPPWHVGGADHKEFYFPRFWGLIFVCYGMFVSFNFWIIGLYMMGPAEPMIMA